jgi:hypothetical protein
MKPANQQTALKAALFMILAANVSWQTSKSLNLVSGQTMHTSELASELGVNRGSIPGRTGGVTAPATAPVIRVQPAPSIAEGPKPDAPISAATVNTKESSQTAVICSLDFKIQFIQETRASDGKSEVHAYVRQVDPARTLNGLHQIGTYRDLIGNPDTKAQWVDLITKNVTAKLKSEGRSCDGRNTDDRGPVVDNDRTRTRTRNDDNGDDARIERGRSNCTLDDNGDALRNSDKASCNLERLAAIELDRTSDDNSDDDRGSRRRRDTSSEGIREVQDALEPLKTSIRQLVLSTNAKRRSDGNRLMNRVLAALAKVSRTAASSADERAMSKIISNLDKSYTTGERVADAAADKADKLSEIDDKVSDLNIRAMTSQNPYERYELQRQANAWTQYRSTEISRLTQNSDYLKLRAYEQAGIIDQSEFADFTADFNALAQTGAMSPGGVTAPDNVLNGRSNITDSRAQGAGLPTYPQINWQQLGLTNPSIAGGPQPGYPQTGFPQTGYQPTSYRPYGMPQSQYGMPQSQYGMPQSNLPMTLPMNVPITQGYGPQYGQQPGMQQPTPGYYNRTMMIQPMFL